MSRELRAELESVQTRLRAARVAVTTPSTPGFNEKREALLEELGPLREATVHIVEREQALEAKALAAEEEVTELRIALRAEQAREDVGVLPVVVTIATLVLGLMAAISFDLHRGLLTELQLVLLAAAPAFLLGLVLRLRIMPK